MNPTSSQTALRNRNAIIGAVVADAAALGFHWLYDQERIQNIEPHAPEFHTPKKSDCEGAPGYFAHGNKKAGECSQYGEQLLAMLHSLSLHNGQYNKTHYENQFIDTFGYGGSYVGYIDHPTRDTLNNITAAENQAIEQAENLPFTGSDTLKRKLITKVLGNAKQFSGQAMAEAVEATVRLTDNDDYNVEHALKMVDILSSVKGLHGADDTQLPALSKLPPLVAVYVNHKDLLANAESAIRVTNNSDVAVEFGAAAVHMMRAAITTGDITQAIDAASSALSLASCETTLLAIIKTPLFWNGLALFIVFHRVVLVVLT